LQLARDRRFDYLVIESTGISDPMPVAETFTHTFEDGSSLGDVAVLDTLVTVVDARTFLEVSTFLGWGGSIGLMTWVAAGRMRAWD
jgi:G3E family GTPase